MAHIKFQQFKIDQIKDTSAVFSGNNIQLKFSSSAHKAEGNGTIIGDKNVIMNNLHTVRTNKPDMEAE